MDKENSNIRTIKAWQLMEYKWGWRERGELRNISKVEISRTHIGTREKNCAFFFKIEGKMMSSALSLLSLRFPGGSREELVKDSHV